MNELEQEKRLSSLLNKRLWKCSSKLDIRSVRYSTLQTCDLTLEQYNEVLEYFVTKRKGYLLNQFSDGCIDSDDAIEILTNHPEIISEIAPKYFIGRDEVIQFIAYNSDLFTFDSLPNTVIFNPAVQDAYKRKVRVYVDNGLDKYGYDVDWKDKNGNLVCYFTLLGNYPITSKDDYLKLVEEYKNSNLTIIQFCDRYQISSVDGFRNLLKRVKLESTIEEENLKKISALSSKKFLASVDKIVSDLLLGEIDFTTYINNYYNSFHNVDIFFQHSEDSKKLANIIASQLLDYIVNNEYTLRIDRLSTFFKADFNLKPAAVESDLEDEVYNFIRKNVSKVDYKKLVKAKKIINVYSKPYFRKNVPSALQFDDVKYEVTNSIIDQTLVYMKNNNIYICMKTFSYFLKMVLKGEVDCVEDLKQEKIDLIGTILVLRKKLKERVNIDDYISTMRQR